MASWTCPRCGNRNEQAFVGCQSCGLPRGMPASPHQAQPDTTPGPITAQGSSTLMGGIAAVALRYWWVLLLVAVPLVGLVLNAQRGDEGEITRGGNLAVTDLRVGDCFDLKDATADEVAEVDAAPCSEPHEFELFHVGNMPAGDYPANADWDGWLEANCLPAFDAYVGIDYLQSRYDIFWFQPSPDGWDEGDRSVQCAVYDPIDDELTTSLRDAGR